MGYYQDYFRAEVRAVTRLSPNLVRIVFGGGDLHRFRSSDVADERLIVVFPQPGAEDPPPPVRMPDGSLDYPDRTTCPPMRSYTIRSWDPVAAEMVIDFVVHDGGVAAPWALQARKGGVVYVTVAAGWYGPQADAHWQVLLADLTGLPALARIVEDVQPRLPTIAIAEVLDDADRRYLPTPSDTRLHWLTGSGNGRGPSRLLSTLRTLELPAGPGYLWYAGEAAESRAVRKFARHEWGWSADQFTILGYWRVKQETWLRRYESVADRLEGVYTSAVASGTAKDDALDLYDDALEKAGL